MPDDASRWLTEGAPKGDDYDARFEAKARAGHDVHGEATFVESLGVRSVLDAGCGTGRVAVELARRGLDVVGVDLDPGMLDTARRKAPDLAWVEGDLAAVQLTRSFDCVVLAGNVMIFLRPGSEPEVVANLARHLAADGLLVAGFQLLPGRFDLVPYDEAAAAAGLELVDRWATWDRAPFAGGDYAVSVHRRR
ncbi:MAG: class I SAM-dependent methyltransferase [Actinomycetota bacterium]